MPVCQELEKRLNDHENLVTSAKNLKQELTEMLVSDEIIITVSFFALYEPLSSYRQQYHIDVCLEGLQGRLLELPLCYLHMHAYNGVLTILGLACFFVFCVLCFCKG